jgi:hypothetical protein
MIPTRNLSTIHNFELNVYEVRTFYNLPCPLLPEPILLPESLLRSLGDRRRILDCRVSLTYGIPDIRNLL